MIEDAISLGLLNLSRDAFFVLDAGGKILYANKTTEKLMGILQENLPGSIFYDYFTEPEKIAGICSKAFTENISNASIKINTNDGQTYLPVSITATHDAKASGHLLVCMKEIEQAASSFSEKSDNFLDTVLDNIPNMIFVKDAKELRFMRFNREGERLLGYSRNDLIGKNDYDFFTKEQADFFVSKDREVLAGKEVLDIPEEPIKTKRGIAWLHTRKIPVFDEKGEALYLVGVSENITESKKANDKIKKLNKSLEKNVGELEEANKNLESFSYSISHDLRAPLRAINGYVRMLEEDYDKVLDGEGKRQLGIIAQNATRMGALIDDLLSLSRLGRKEVAKVDIDMNALIQTVMDEIGKILPHRAEIKTGILHPARGDSKLLQQVFINLLSNAIKYSSKKEHPVVQINSRVKNREVIYSISDNGTGFDMKYADKLFNIFQRLHTHDEFEGTGVGLAIVKRIIDKHGGKIWPEAEEGHGATFYFSLQRAKKPHN